MLLRRLRWIFFAATAVFVALLEGVRYLTYPSSFRWSEHLVTDAFVAIGIFFFFGAFFEIIVRIQDRVGRQNRELLALHHAALDIYGEPTLNAVLQKVVDQARYLLEARFGAVSVTDESLHIQEFLTSGVDPELREKIGSLPQGHGLLGVALKEGQRLRLSDILADPRAVGFPPHHPVMRSLVAVPIVCKGPFRGNLYVADKEAAQSFSAEDEETLARFATKAAIAIDNAYLHQRLRALAIAEERARIAAEMHDGLAQVLAYVNTKAQAVGEFIRRGETEKAQTQLEELAAAAREVYTDAREGILALRSQAGPGAKLEEVLKLYLQRWQEQSGIEGRLRTNGPLRLEHNTELQLTRIIQEALSNVRKHSGAKRVEVELKQQGSRVIATIGDDGAGFAPGGRATGSPRFGLAIMHERAESLGGSLTINSSPPDGTEIRVEVPIQPVNL